VCVPIWPARFFRNASPRSVLTGVPLAFAATFWGTSVVAEDSASAPQSFLEAEVRYEAPASCPERDMFLARVAERRSQPRTAPSPDVQVTITSQGTGFTARLVLRSGESSVSRQVSGEVCEEVASAIALVTALALDAHVQGVLQADAPATSSAQDPESSAPEMAEETEAPAATAAVASPVSRAAPAKTRPAPRVRPHQVNWGIGLQFDADPAPSPDWLYGPSGHALIGVDDWAHEYRVGVGYRFRGSGDYPLREATKFPFEVSLLTARLEACPWAWRVAPLLTLRPCAAGELGRFLATAWGAQSSASGAPRKNSQLWGSLFVTPRVELHVSPRLSLELAPQVQFPLNSDTEIELDADPRPDVTRTSVIHRVEMIELYLSSGLRLNFP
jgi:hypothetical protein